MSMNLMKRDLRGRMCDLECARNCLLLALALMTVACSSRPNMPAVERRITREEFGDNWPFTSAEGVVACDQSRTRGRAIVFTTGGVTYGVNDIAKSLGYPAIDPLRRSNLSPGRPRKVTVERVPASARRAIFAAVTACEDRAREHAERRYPRDDPPQPPPLGPHYIDRLGFDRVGLVVRLRERCESLLRRTHRLSAQDLGLIIHEGTHYSWPPLPPVRVSIAPIIGIGLEYCRFDLDEQVSAGRPIW